MPAAVFVPVASRSRGRSRRSPIRIVIARGNDIRGFTLRPWFAGSCIAAATVFGMLYLAATAYLVLRDDTVAPPVTSQSDMQRAYEDRIASLRSDIDRLTSRQVASQQAVADKVDELVDRQAALDKRQDMLAGLKNAAHAAGVSPPAETGGPSAKAEPSAPPLITGSLAPVEAGAIGSVATLFGQDRNRGAATGTSDGTRIAAVESSIDSLSHEQADYVEKIAVEVGGRADKASAVLKSLGVSPPRSADDDVGGPYIPIDPNADPETFRATVDLVSGELTQLADLRTFSDKLPLSKPLTDGVEGSGFGIRLDPFFHRPAFHPGLDFQAETGDAVHATAPGKVLTAGLAAGYGKMVEIDHGNGITTRYGHLSQILVRPGQTIAEGAVIGRTGSTGRSTGPHLHYEVRVDGKPIDPARYINAGTQLSAVL